MRRPDNDRAIASRLGAACVTLLFGVEMVVLARAGHALPGIAILAALSAPFALFAVCGLARLGIEDRGVRVVNSLRTLRVDWKDIEGFSLGRHGLLREVGIAQLRDGRRVAIWAIQGPNAVRRLSTISAQRLIAAMNSELARRRPAATAESSYGPATAAQAPAPRPKLVAVPSASAPEPSRRAPRAA